MSFLINYYYYYDICIEKLLPTSCLTVVGHIHMTKAGGTTLNGMLANAYHGVCGYKGYSLLGSTSTEISNGQYTCVDQCFSTGRFSCI